MKNGLLAGVRVLDLTIWRPGPYATQLLGELGADIVKVEPPGGDPMRAYPGIFAGLSANKRSIELDMKSVAGRARVLQLAAEADVVIEGFRPGVVARLGVSYDDVRARNERVVYCSLSGLGQVGDLANASGHDLNYQAWSGALAPEGNAPVSSAVPIADLAGGLTAAYAICAALVRQARTGEGEYIDVAMADILATWTGAVPPHARGVDPSIRGVPGYGMFVTADGGFVTLAILTEDHFWRGLCDVLGLADARDLGFVERMQQMTSLQERIGAAIAARARDEFVDACLAANVPAAPVLDRDAMLALPHFRQRNVVRVDNDGAPAMGHLVRFVKHPAAWNSPPPEIDEHHGTGFRS